MAYIEERILELRERALKASTWLDLEELEEALAGEREWVNNDLRKRRRDPERAERIVDRHVRRLGEVDEFWLEHRDRAKARFEERKAFRDEITEGIRESQKIRRAETRTIKKIVAEFAAEKARREKQW